MRDLPVLLVEQSDCGQKTQLTYGNNLVSKWTYDPDRFWVDTRKTGTLVGQTFTPTQQDITYGRDPVGGLLTLTDAFSATGSRTFTYDDLNRLGTAIGNFGPNQSSQNCTYVYSAIGNIDSRCGTTFSYGDSMHPSAVTFNPATNKTYTYDNNGNMLTRSTPTVSQTLTYDIENRVISVTTAGSSTNMEYDYTGMRVKKSAPTGTTLYPFQGYEVAPGGEITKFIRIGVETFASKRGTSKLYYHNDHLGSVHVITDESAVQVQLNEYDPWGGVSKSIGTVDPTHRFTGKELDPETGLYYYGGRYYDPEISRFVSADPYIQGPDNPQNLNRYNYVGNDPQNYIDPTGYHHLRYDRRGGYLGAFLGGFAAAIISVVVPAYMVELGLMGPAQAAAFGAGLGAATSAAISGKSFNELNLAWIRASVTSLIFSGVAEVFSLNGGSNTLAVANSAGTTTGSSGAGGIGGGAPGAASGATAGSSAVSSSMTFAVQGPYYYEGILTGRILAPSQKIFDALSSSLDRVFGTPVGSSYLPGARKRTFIVQSFPDRNITQSQVRLVERVRPLIELGLQPGSYRTIDNVWAPFTYERVLGHELGHVYGPHMGLSENEILNRFENPIARELSERDRACYRGPTCARPY